MILILPILIPLFCIILSLIIGRNVNGQKILGLSGSFGLLTASFFLFIKVYQQGIQVMHIGNWPAPYGIPVVADMFSAIMVVVSGVLAFSASVFSIKNIDKERYMFRYYLFFFGMLMGVNGIFLTGDVFNMYVWFEVMLMASFALMVLGNEKQQLEGTIKYLVLSLVSSLLFFAGAGLLYGQTGTLNIADLSRRFANDQSSFVSTTSAVLFFIAFGIKSAVFPFFFWLPASYHTPPVAVTAFFSGLLTKVGTYSMIRFFTMFFVSEGAFWHNFFIITAGITMIIGVITAAPQNDIRKLLLFHIISQMGYIVMGLGIFTPLAISGAIYFIIHNAIAKTNIFFIAGLIHRSEGSFNLTRLGGLYDKKPFLSLLFFIPAIALAGIPPLSGFFGKYVLAKAGFDSGNYTIAAISLFAGLMTVFYMFKIWNEAFLKPASETEVHQEKFTFSMVFPSVLLGLISIVLGTGAGFIFKITNMAAGQLLNRADYIEKVLAG